MKSSQRPTCERRHVEIKKYICIGQADSIRLCQHRHCLQFLFSLGGRWTLQGEQDSWRNPRLAHLLSSALVAPEVPQTNQTFGCASTRLLCWDFKYTQRCWTLKCFHRLQLLKPFTSRRQPLTYVGDEKTSFHPEVQENSGAGNHVLHNSLTTRRILDGKISLPCVD